MEAQTSKYVCEWTLVLTVLGAALGRQQDFEKVGPPTDYDCHLYLVTKRPRISVDPDSVTITEATISFTLRLQRNDSFDEYPLSGTHPLGPGPWQWSATWPYEDFAIVHEVTGEEPISGTVAALQRSAGGAWPRAATEHQVLYVGQAFGAQGERTAWDRLKSHSTLQRILAETEPDQQVWLTLAAVTDVSGSQIFSPDAEPEYTKAERERDVRIAASIYHDTAFRERDCVALAEAGLIRYFQPQYNDRLKSNFPAPRQVPLESVRSYDFHSLVVELQGQELGARYGSEVVPHDVIHFERFVIHNDADRQDPFALLTQETSQSS